MGESYQKDSQILDKREDLCDCATALAITISSPQIQRLSM